MLVSGAFAEQPAEARQHPNRGHLPPQDPYKRPPPYNYQAEYGYCDPRTPPKCVQNATDTYCLKDYEYPEKEVQVIYTTIVIWIGYYSMKNFWVSM